MPRTFAVADYDLILGRHEQRSTNHASSEKSKNPRGLVPNTPSLHVGDIVYFIPIRTSVARVIAMLRFPLTFFGASLSECYATPPSVIVPDHPGL